MPLCSNSKKKQPYLINSFPTDEKLKKRWIWAIRREERATFTVRKGSTFVCAKHFMEDEVRVHPESSRKYILHRRLCLPGLRGTVGEKLNHARLRRQKEVFVV